MKDDVFSRMYIACADQRIECPDRGLEAMKDTARVLIEDMRERNWGPDQSCDASHHVEIFINAYAKDRGIE